mmetsp:Transcript_47413/g.103404  ORF Transcript_47413/g.103404 Transcript_47413/m.103404 type:complete len:247 (+) Transcript_47413:2779-3519(+)
MCSLCSCDCLCFQNRCGCRSLSCQCYRLFGGVQRQAQVLTIATGFFANQGLRFARISVVDAQKLICMISISNSHLIQVIKCLLLQLIQSLMMSCVINFAMQFFHSILVPFTGIFEIFFTIFNLAIVIHLKLLHTFLQQLLSLGEVGEETENTRHCEVQGLLLMSELVGKCMQHGSHLIKTLSQRWPNFCVNKICHRVMAFPFLASIMHFQLEPKLAKHLLRRNIQCFSQFSEFHEQGIEGLLGSIV